MRNRAKCKKCGSVIESFHRYDYVECKCKEISIDGGNDYCNASAKDWRNFLRVDDNGNDIEVKVIDKDSNDVKPLYTDENTNVKPSKDEIIQMIDNMIKDIENLPSNALYQPVTNYDLMSVLLLISAAFKS